MSLHRTAAKRCSLDAPNSSDAAFAGIARFRRQSVSSIVRHSNTCASIQRNISRKFKRRALVDRQSPRKKLGSACTINHQMTLTLRSLIQLL